MRMSRNNEHLGKYSDWTDAELNAKINEAYRMFLTSTEMIRETATVTFTDGVGNAPTGLIAIKRIEVDNAPAGVLVTNTYDEDLPI